MPPYDLDYTLVGITQSLAFLRGRVWLVDANVCLSSYAVCRHHFGAKKNRPGSISQAHGITKIVALFRGQEGV